MHGGGIKRGQCVGDTYSSGFVSRSNCMQHDRLLAQYCRLSACLSVMLCIVALKVGVGVAIFTVVFLAGYFLFTSYDTFAVRCIVQSQLLYDVSFSQHTAKNRTAEIFVSRITRGSVVTWLYGLSGSGIFEVRFCSYTVQRTYLVRSAFLARATRLVMSISISSWVESKFLQHPITSGLDIR